MNNLRGLLVLSVLSMSIGLSAYAQPTAEVGKRAFLKLTVPADAKVEIDGIVISQTGPVRLLASPPITDLTRKYEYTIKATWMIDGKPVTKTIGVEVIPGTEKVVDFIGTPPLAKKEEPKKEEPKKVEPKKEEPKKVEPKKEEPKKVEPAPKKEEMKKEEPKKVEPKKEEPKKPEVGPKPPEVKKEEPKKVEPTPKPPEPKKEEPKKPEVGPKPTEVKKDASAIVVPYVRTPTEVVEAMLKLASVQPSDSVYDLGCGDGRIVIAAVTQFKAKRGTGIDLDPVRVRESVEAAKKANVADRVEFRQGDVLKLRDLSEATVVTLYLLPEVNEKLMPVLKSTLKPGSRIVSHDFTMGDGWKPEKEIVVVDKEKVSHRLYLWTIPAPKK